MRLRKLEEKDDRAGFRCGEPQLDAFFREVAGQAQFRQRTSATYVVADDREVMGYVTVVPGVVRREDNGSALRRLPPGPVPVLVLARLAVILSHQRRGLGNQLVIQVLSLALNMAREVGCAGIVVDSKPASRAFYERYDFKWLQEQSRPNVVRGFLPIRAIEAAAYAQSL